MSDPIVPRDQLVKTGGKAVGGIGGGIVLLALNSVTGFLPAVIIGGLLTAGGLGIAGSSPEDKTAGTIAAAAGIATISSALPLVGGLASTLLWGGGVVLLGAGIYSAFKFWQGLRSRR
ncbi:hypothetical protein [Spirochaeta africana]|uniref:Uncharacterized protein n=1 Tax=Spirochaeta africana (strain ATCC 700263 / DSM 8902 / Z-7692) TaxID=889378 RepID=H9UJI0_SPIAZ|nr:hypothetical protein [Spirochaeta africana]AFG37673.1 hypothetical protein Spiaf_1615 [Spirochaeta africana DSM 8902]